MLKIHYLIVPAWSDQAGQCRIVSRVFPEDARGSDLQHYRAHPAQWAEAGTMNSKGKLVALDGTREIVQEFKDCEPLAAGMSFTFDAREAEMAAAVPERFRGG